MKRTRAKDCVIGILFVVIILLAGFSYYWSEESLAKKDGEIDSLNEEIETLQEKFDNSIEFTTRYLKATDTIVDAYINEATANDYYDWGHDFYEEGDFSEADEYWTYSMFCFSNAAGYYRESKVFFSSAGNLAPTEDYRALLSVYTKLAESGAKTMDYMYEAAEYYASASVYYSQEKWKMGDSAVGIGGERIASYDAEVLIFNDLLAEIKVIKDLL